jgi:hypothetical protein
MYERIPKKEKDDRKYPYRDADLIGISSIFMAEYGALRREIEISATHQKDMMNFSILTFTAMVGLFGVPKAQETSQSLSYVYLLFPWVFYLLLLQYADKTIRILRVADYIQNNLRRKVIETCGEYFWQWEIYKSYESYPLTSKKLALLLDKSRWLIFIFPSIISIVLFLTAFEDAKNVFRHTIVLLLIADVVALFIISLWVIPKLDETMGVRTREDIMNLDGFEKDRKAEGIARIITQNLDKLPQETQEVLLEELSNNDEAVGAVSRALAEHLDKLPKYMRNDQLKKLSKYDEAAGIVANTIARYYKKLPEDVTELLFDLAENEETAYAAANALTRYYEKLPEKARNKLLEALVKKKENGNPS